MANIQIRIFAFNSYGSIDSPRAFAITLMEILESGRRNIVVLGAGFGGITALLKLHKLLKRYRLFPGYNLVLVNKQSQHLYTPALYEIASIPKGQADAVCLKSAICIQIEDILKRRSEIRFIGEEAAKLDPRTHIITFASGNQLNFEYAIIALGAETNFFNIPGLRENGYPIKTFEDALRLRNRLEELVRTLPARIKIIIGGAGATGVEVAAEFMRFFGYFKKEARRECEAEITLVEARPEILAGFSPGIIRRARRRLDKLGVLIMTEAAISRVRTDEIVLQDGRILPYHLLVWSGGVSPAAVLKNFGLGLDKKGGAVVNEFMEAKPRIYAVGDNAGFINPKTGKPMQWNVPVAETEARIAAKNIISDILGRKRKRFKPLKNYPFILAVGGKYALTDLVIVKFFGFLGWLLKQLVELRYLLSILPWPKAMKMWLRAVYYQTRND